MPDNSTGSAAQQLLPAVDYLKIPDQGEPFLEGHCCDTCGAVFLGARTVCSGCGTRDGMTAKPLGRRGTLYSWSIVHRSFPGVTVPYISAIVDLEGGGTVKGNLLQVPPDPDQIPFDLPVELVFADAGRQDQDGNSYLAYFFQPVGAGATP